MTNTSETLAQWYLRLNGFFTIPNFVVHPSFGDQQRTDIDVFGVRLPYRRELREQPMQDDEIFTRVGNKIYLVFAEATVGAIKLNSSWSDESEQNVKRFLDASGALPPDEIDAATTEIYKNGVFSNGSCYASFIAFGATRSKNLARKYAEMPQITWQQVGRFIFKRFGSYPEQKQAHLQWEAAGHSLWELWRARADNEAAFMEAFLSLAQSRGAGE